MIIHFPPIWVMRDRRLWTNRSDSVWFISALSFRSAPVQTSQHTLASHHAGVKLFHSESTHLHRTPQALNSWTRPHELLSRRPEQTSAPSSAHTHTMPGFSCCASMLACNKGVGGSHLWHKHVAERISRFVSAHQHLYDSWECKATGE